MVLIKRIGEGFAFGAGQVERRSHCAGGQGFDSHWDLLKNALHSLEALFRYFPSAQTLTRLHIIYDIKASKLKKLRRQVGSES